LPSSKQYPTIKYTSRDFNSIKSDLIDYARRYYPDTYKDFSDSGFGSLMLDTVAYIGDILSFYLDYSVNESFLDTAIEFENILKIGKQMGYKFNSSPASYGEASFYIIVPASTSEIGPDFTYVPILKKGSGLSSMDGVGFTLNEDVNFSNPNNEIVVGRVDDVSGVPTSYAIKALGQVISGKINSEKISVGDFQKFLKLSLAGENITEILSVTDIEGNEYFEVDFLSQDIVYKSVINRGDNNTVTQANLRPFAVPRRFTTERLKNKTILQFGFGSKVNDVTINPLVDPSMVALKVHGKNYTTDVNFDPTNFTKTDKFGIAPANTTLTVVYRSNDARNVNIGTNSLIRISAPFFDFPDLSSLNSSLVTGVVSSLEVTNEEPITGDVTMPSVLELKTRIHNVFSSQNRAVTLQDYKSLCYSMPTQFGSVKRVNVIRDPESLKRNLNLYLISEDSAGKLTKTNEAIKQNLKIWLNQGRMINDTVDILDAKVINIGIEFVAIGTLETNKYDLLTASIQRLKKYYNRMYDIGEPFYITHVFNELNKMDGIVDVTRVNIVQRTGANYSSEIFNIESRRSDDGRYIKVPQNAIIEIKYPDIDIIGTIK